jgi:hypothetical protein
MDYSLTIWILLLPFISFLILGLAGMKMSHETIMFSKDLDNNTSLSEGRL